MKLKYITNSRIPTEKAHGYQIVKMCSEFSRLGAEVELILPSRDNPIITELFEYYNLTKSFSYKYLKSYDWLKYVNILGRFSFYLQTLSFSFKLFFLKIEKGCIVYTRNPIIVWIFSLRKFKIVYESHDWFSRSKKLSLFMLKKCRFVIATNNYIKNEFIKNGFKNVLVMPNGIDLSIFDINLSKEQSLGEIDLSVRAKKNLKNKKILMYTGSFTTMGVDKGIEDIFRAIKKLSLNDLFFIAVGGSDKDIDKYSKKAKELGIDSQVLLVGREKQKNLAEYQKLADILLMPFPDKAHYKYFMTPLKMFEYMASGVPVIASDLPSIKEVLNKNNCLFCTPGDYNDLSEKISFLLENNKFGEKLAKQARIDVKKYTWEKRAKKIIDIIK